MTRTARSRFYSRKRGLERPTIELTVKNDTVKNGTAKNDMGKNDTGKTVSRAYFHGILKSSGRSVPWVEDDFNHPTSDGVEPGAKTTWRLIPKSGEWGKAPKNRSGMVLTITVLRLDGPHGQVLFDATGFDKDDEKRLTELRRRLASLR